MRLVLRDVSRGAHPYTNINYEYHKRPAGEVGHFATNLVFLQQTVGVVVCGLSPMIRVVVCGLSLPPKCTIRSRHGGGGVNVKHTDIPRTGISSLPITILRLTDADAESQFSPFSSSPSSAVRSSTSTVSSPFIDINRNCLSKASHLRLARRQGFASKRCNQLKPERRVPQQPKIIDSYPSKTNIVKPSRPRPYFKGLRTNI